MSIEQFVQKEYKVLFENRECIIFDKFLSNQLIAKVKMTSNRMFPQKVKAYLNLKYAQAHPTMNS